MHLFGKLLRPLVVLIVAGIAASACRYAWSWVGPQGAWMACYEGVDLQQRHSVKPLDSIAFFYDRNPAKGVSLTNFSARLSGWLYVSKGKTYDFASLSDGGIRVYIDGRLVINNWREQPWKRSGSRSDSISLARGWHPLRVEFFNSDSNARVRVEWCGGDIPPRTTIGGVSLWKYRMPFGK